MGLPEIVQDHSRRLNGIEDRERELVATLGKLTLAVDRCERPLKTISWATRAVAAALIVLICGALWKMFEARIAEPPPPPNVSERSFLDRVDPPDRNAP